MSILNEDYFIDIYINTRQSIIKSHNKITMYNTDKNIATFKVGLFKEKCVPIEIKDCRKFKVILTILRCETNSVIEITGELDTNTDYGVYLFKIPEDYLNRIGLYKCEITIVNGEESLTFNYFEYVIEESMVTDLNEEIESNPDLPILKQLIEKVETLIQEVEQLKG